MILTMMQIMSKQNRNRTLLYSFCRNIPLLGTAIGILNAYAYRGDHRAGREFAGVMAYVAALWRPLSAALVLTVITLYPWVHAFISGAEPSAAKLSIFLSSPGVITVSIFPSVLGFGIGVYALVFAIPERLVRDLDKAMTEAIDNGLRKRGSVLVLNADLGYPLMVLIIALAMGVLQQARPDILWLVALCWLTFWYAVVSMVEIVGVLFQIGDHAVLDKRGIVPDDTNGPQG